MLPSLPTREIASNLRRFSDALSIFSKVFAEYHFDVKQMRCVTGITCLWKK